MMIVAILSLHRVLIAISCLGLFIIILSGCRQQQQRTVTKPISYEEPLVDGKPHKWTISVEGTPGLRLHLSQYIQKEPTSGMLTTRETITLPFSRTVDAVSCHFDFKADASSHLYKKPHEVKISLSKDGIERQGVSSRKETSPFLGAGVGPLKVK